MLNDSALIKESKDIQTIHWEFHETNTEPLRLGKMDAMTLVILKNYSKFSIYYT